MTSKSKTGKFKLFSFNSVSGGKDPVNIIEEFITEAGFEPAKCQKHKSADHARWMLAVQKGIEMEVLLEGLANTDGPTLYMGVNALIVPIRRADEMIAVALEAADGLVGTKVSLVGHFLVLSASIAASDTSVDEIDYYFKLIMAQLPWFKSTVLEELGWDTADEIA